VQQREQPVAVYLDVCCLNRPFDDQTQERIRDETRAVYNILLRVRRRELAWISSAIVDREVRETPERRRRTRVQRFIRFLAGTHIEFDDTVEQRARELGLLGFDPADALHLACAERGGAELFFTVDDRLVRRAARVADALHLKVQNPRAWVAQQEGSA